MNVLNHLGFNLYSSVPAVLSEAIANAWDADAENVVIQIDPAAGLVIIQDDGKGMTTREVNEKYLTIGYARRKNGEGTTSKLNRPVMGRKGIGKLSLFSIAGEVYVTSKGADGKLNGFFIDSKKIKDLADSGNQIEYSPELYAGDDLLGATGTTIKLQQLNSKLTKGTLTGLTQRLARRFSVISPSYSFSVELNGNPISAKDRNIFPILEAAYNYDSPELVAFNQKDHSISVVARSAEASTTSRSERFSGWIGLAKSSSDLEGEVDSLNKISLFIRGKLAKEDLLENMRLGGLYTKYIIGEIHADFLDEDNKDDITTSNRQSLVEIDPSFEALRDKLRSELRSIEGYRKELKNNAGVDVATQNEAINDWYKTLTGDTKSQAKKLFGKINQLSLEQSDKTTLFANSVVAFESLRYRDKLSQIDDIDSDNIEAFILLLKDFDAIEASLYYKITEERLKIIEKLRVEFQDQNALEKALQETIFKYLWLLDPSWDRATEPEKTIETTIAKYFGPITAKLPAKQSKDRLDILVRVSARKYIIIELKRADVSIDTETLTRQIKKYRTALRKTLREHGISDSAIECIAIVGKQLTDWEDEKSIQESVNAMSQYDLRVLTYEQLTTNSFNQYSAYIESKGEARKLVDLLKRIESQI